MGLRILLSLMVFISSLEAHAVANQAFFISYDTFGGIEHPTLLRHLKKANYGLKILSPHLAEFAEPLTPTCAIFLASLAEYSDPERYPGLETLLIFFDLHGEPQTHGEITHAIRFGDERFSMDRIQGVLKKIAARGTKIVIISFSCYAGLTVHLATASPNIFVITVSEECTPAIPWFMNAFTQSLLKGALNPEEIELVRTGLDNLYALPIPGIASPTLRTVHLTIAERRFFERRYSELEEELLNLSKGDVETCRQIQISDFISP